MHGYSEEIHGGLIQKSTTPTALFHTNHTLTQGCLHYRLATLGYQKRNTYGVETFISYHDSHFFAPEFMVDYAEKIQRLQRCEMHVDLLFIA